MKMLKMHQINYYTEFVGISAHADEMAWFGGDLVYTARLLGSAELHFGNKGQGKKKNEKAIWKDLKISTSAGSVLAMGGIFQCAFKHSIPRGKIFASKEAITWISRDVHENVEDQWTYMW